MTSYVGDRRCNEAGYRRANRSIMHLSPLRLAILKGGLDDYKDTVRRYADPSRIDALRLMGEKDYNLVEHLVK